MITEQVELEMIFKEARLLIEARQPWLLWYCLKKPSGWRKADTLNPVNNSSREWI